MADDAKTWTTPEGDASRHLPLDEILSRLEALPLPPRERGTVVALFARPGRSERRELEQAELTAAGGMPGDRWSRKDAPKPDQMLATMNIGVARTIANGQPIGLFGDNLYVDLDLSEANLPIGTRVRAGGAVLEVTPEPHNGCLKFKGRFGGDALRLVSRKENRHENLRGVYFKVVEDGPVKAGDPLEVLR